jgi:hypothetical protein
VADPCVRCKANPEIREPQEAVANASGELPCLPHLREALKEEPGVAFVSTEWGWREPGRRTVFELHRLDGEAARALTASRRARGQEVTLVRRTVTYGEWETVPGDETQG